MALISVSNNALQNITAVPASIPTGALVLLSTQTASASASIEFSMDSSYYSYIFKFINIHPANDGVDFNVQGSTNNGTSYGVTTTNTYFRSIHDESDTTTQLAYDGGEDVAQGTGFFPLTMPIGSDNDQNGVGILKIFNPSSDTFVKHFICTSQIVNQTDFSGNVFVAGYFNTTSPITNLKFQFDSGNIDDGIIKMYGVK